jgi:hypothetical protein
MFCPACGLESNQKTKYCKRCGKSLNEPSGTVETTRGSKVLLAVLFASVGVFGLLGLALLFAMYDNMVIRNLRGDALMIPFVMGICFISAIAGLLIWQLSRLITAFQKTAQHTVIERHYIKEAQQGQLGAPTDRTLQSVEPLSVVEETTRQFVKQ